MHGPKALPGPPFSATSRTPRSADNGSINTPQLCVNDNLSLQILKDCIQSAVAIPLVKQTPYGLPLSKLFWQISPRGTCGKNPEDSIKDVAAVENRTTAWFSIRNQPLDSLPLIIVYA